LICRFTFLTAEILIAERWPELELELWKFISFPVSERQFLLVSGQLRPAELKQRQKQTATASNQSIQGHTVFFQLVEKE